MIKNILMVFVNMFSFLKYPLAIVGVLFALFYLLVIANIVVGLFKGKRFQKSKNYRRIKKRSFLKKIFIDLPKRISDDMFKKNPDFFKYQGLIIFEGRQGSGKTISAIQCAMQMQKEYQLAKCITNLGYTKQNDELNHWKQLIDYVNGIYGVIVVMDETQNWFSSTQSRNFPPEMLQVITQNRKNRRVILRNCTKFLFTC